MSKNDSELKHNSEVIGIEVDDESIKGIFSSRKYSVSYFDKVSSRVKRFVAEDGSEDIVDTLMDFNYIITRDKNSSVPKYVDAVRFCQLSLNNSNAKAWKRVFPDRYQDVVDKFKTPEEIKRQTTLRANTYAQGKMVVGIKTDMLIPTHIMYANVRKDGVQKQIDLMNGKAAPSYLPQYVKDERGKFVLDENGQRQFLYINGIQQFEEIHQVVSPKIQQEAAKAVIELTTAPETLKIEANVHHSSDAKVMEQNVQIMDSMRKFAIEQRKLAMGGADINDLQKVAHIIDVVPDYDDEEEE